MSNKLINKAYRLSAGGPTRKAVLMYLCNCLNEDTKACFPSIATIARDTEFCVRAVTNALKVLKDAGIVEVVEKGGPGKGSNRYDIHLDAIQNQMPVDSASNAIHMAPDAIDVVHDVPSNHNKNQNINRKEPGRKVNEAGFALSDTIPTSLSFPLKGEAAGERGNEVSPIPARPKRVFTIDPETGAGIWIIA